MSNFASVEAEQAVLGSMLIDSGCVCRVAAILRESDFSVALNQDLYRVIVTMDRDGQPIDGLTVCAEALRQSLAEEKTLRKYLAQLMEITPTAANVAEYAEIVAGTAPEALEELPAPTHVFIGGSGGTMGETVRCILQKNPLARVVINAIALETLSQVLALSRELPLSNLEVVQIAAARTKEIGGYHMMNGGNPVFICSFGGLPWQVQD